MECAGTMMKSCPRCDATNYKKHVFCGTCGFYEYYSDNWYQYRTERYVITGKRDECRTAICIIRGGNKISIGRLLSYKATESDIDKLMVLA